MSGDAGSALTIDTVLMVNQDGSVKIGSPTIDGAKVEAEVVKHTRGPKLIIWKMKRRGLPQQERSPAGSLRTQDQQD